MRNIFKKHSQEESTPEEAYIKYLKKMLDEVNEKIATLENTNAENINVAKKHIALWVYFISTIMSADVDEMLTDVRDMIEILRGKAKYDL